MDYTQSFFAGNPPFQQQFIGIPPLTPSHSNSAASDDYNTTSPPEGFPDFHNEAFSSFDSYGVQFTPQQPVFPGPPTPPGQQHLTHAAVHVPGAPQERPHQQPHPQQQHPQQPHPQPPATAALSASLAAAPAQPAPNIPPPTKSEPGLDDLVWQQQQQEQNQRGGSNSDDDELTPAQSRRKAQNRAAQRAFRERKERHVKDLEALNASLKETQQKIASENERLKRDLQKISTENEILRATSSLHAAAAAAASPASDAAPGSMPLAIGPMTYNPTDFYTDLLVNHDNKTPSHRVATSASGERLLAAGATWDLIVSHELYRRGLVDLADISNRLKSQAKCDGQGPVFEESAILAAIEQSVSSGSDSLL